MPQGRVLEFWRWHVKSRGGEQVRSTRVDERGLGGDRTHALLHACVRCAIPTRDPDTQVKLPELLRHLDAHHETRFGINARVLQAGRIAADEAVATDPGALRR